jgi:hypothetical protein
MRKMPRSPNSPPCSTRNRRARGRNIDALELATRQASVVKLLKIEEERRWPAFFQL